MDNTLPYSNEYITNFIEALDDLIDPRDNRGKRHSLPFVIASVTLAILAGRSRVSSIFRYIRNRIEWLREVTQVHDATPIFRAHLPRLLERMNWEDLNALIERHFNVNLKFGS